MRPPRPPPIPASRCKPTAPRATGPGNVQAALAPKRPIARLFAVSRRSRTHPAWGHSGLRHRIGNGAGRPQPNQLAGPGNHCHDVATRRETSQCTVVAAQQTRSIFRVTVCLAAASLPTLNIVASLFETDPSCPLVHRRAGHRGAPHADGRHGQRSVSDLSARLGGRSLEPWYGTL